MSKDKKRWHQTYLRGTALRLTWWKQMERLGSGMVKAKGRLESEFWGHNPVGAQCPRNEAHSLTVSFLPQPVFSAHPSL